MAGAARMTLALPALVGEAWGEPAAHVAGTAGAGGKEKSDTRLRQYRSRWLRGGQDTHRLGAAQREIQS